MNLFTISLRLIAFGFLVVSCIHLFYGASAEVMLGAKLSEEALADAVLDSQNRFYGVAFALYGVVFYLASCDLLRYSSMLKAALWVFFMSGLARVVSIMSHGLPSFAIQALTVIELILPLLLLYWLRLNLSLIPENPVRSTQREVDDENDIM